MVHITEEQYASLTDRERQYYRMIRPQHGVLYLKSEPGRAKTAILASLAKKLNWQYIDLRLAQLDPIAVGMFPSTEVVTINNQSIKVMDFVTPKWALLANQKPTLINFDELNRAPEDVLKAAMQIFNERAIGTQFKFNDNVFMVATGNLGQEDNTDVNELDSALNGRLIHMKHNLSWKEWVEWGRTVIHPTIISFIEAFNGDYLFDAFKTDKNKSDVAIQNEAYASPRTWHFLSEYIVTNYGINSNIKTWYKDIANIAKMYVGVLAAKEFMKYCNQILELSLQDILAGNQRTMQKLSVFKQQQALHVFMSIINTLARCSKEFLLKLNTMEIANLNTFFSYCSKEQVAASLNTMMDIFNEDLLNNNQQAIDLVQGMYKGHADVLNAINKYRLL